MNEQLFPGLTFDKLMQSISFVAAVQQYIAEDHNAFPSAMQLGHEFELKIFVTLSRLNDRAMFNARCTRFNIPTACRNRVWLDFAPAERRGHYIPFQDAIRNPGRRI